MGSLPSFLRAGPSVNPLSVCRFPLSGYLPLSLLCAGLPPSVTPPLCAGSPQWVLAPFSPVCRSSALCHPPPPPPCVQDPPQRVVPPLSRLCVQVSLCAGLPLSVQVSLSLCRSPSLCAGLSTPLFVQDPPLWVVPSLALCRSPSLCAGLSTPPLCAGSPSVGSSPTPSVVCVQSPLLFCLGAAEQVGSGGSVDKSLT